MWKTIWYEGGSSWFFPLHSASWGSFTVWAVFSVRSNTKCCSAVTARSSVVPWLFSLFTECAVLSSVRCKRSRYSVMIPKCGLHYTAFTWRSYIWNSKLVCFKRLCHEHLWNGRYSCRIFKYFLHLFLIFPQDTPFWGHLHSIIFWIFPFWILFSLKLEYGSTLILPFEFHFNICYCLGKKT